MLKAHVGVHQVEMQLVSVTACSVFATSVALQVAGVGRVKTVAPYNGSKGPAESPGGMFGFDVLEQASA